MGEKKHHATTHGYSYTRLYKTWKNIRRRCHKQTAADFPLYGGRGIKVCDEWRSDFVIFKTWSLSEGYTDILQIDRIDTNGDYAPNNCRWVTNKENSNNRRTNVQITIDGETKNLTQWAEESGIAKSTLWRRVNKYGLVGKELLRPIRRASK